MKASELRNMKASDLHAKLQELYKDQIKLVMQLRTGNLNKNHLLGVNKKAIARAKTVLRELEQASS